MCSDADIIARGTHGTVRFAVQSNERRPAKRFLEEILRKSPKKYARLLTRFASVANGVILDGGKFKLLGASIWEFKVSSIRVLCFQDGSEWFLTNGFEGKRGLGNCPKEAIEKAKRIRREHLKRKKRNE